jgi:predicted RNase H-like nuclease
VRLKRGPTLPYRRLAGVEPCPKGWLVIPGKLQGVSMFPEPPGVVASFLEILDSTPAFEVIALHCPIGLLSDRHPGGRRCDEEARRLLGPRRGAGIISPPSSTSVETGNVDGLSAVARSLLPRIRDVYRDIASYHQRTVFEVHPELGFYQLNNDRPLRFAKASEDGLAERLALLQPRMPGLEQLLNRRPKRVSVPTLLDGCVDLWTARRIAARAIVRIPQDPEWGADGLKMELVR